MRLVAGKVEDMKMKRLKIAVLVLGVFVIAALPAGAAIRFRGGIVAGPAFGPWGWYSPYYYGPGAYSYGPYLPYGPYPLAYSNAGEVKLKTNVKDADVFINGALAGKASKLKSIWLPPNGYNLEIRAAGYTTYSERIYVIPGNTIHVQADLTAAPRG